MQVDGGSNCNLLADAGARDVSELVHDRSSRGTIGGIAGGLSFNGVAVSSLALGATLITLAFLYTPHGARNILSESVLLDTFGIEAVKRSPPRLEFPDGSTVPMHREHGLFYVDVVFHSALGAPALAARPSPIAASSNVAADDAALLWASRMDADADGLLRLARSVTGTNVVRLTNRQREVINSSIPRAIAQARHAPAHATPPARLATSPADRLICDGFGKHHAASPVDGAVYQFHAVCEYSSYGYIASGKTHTVDDWIAFIRHVMLDARSHGHTPRTLRFDRAPELATPELARRVEAELGLLVELTPRERHEGVGRAERNNDVLTRAAEAMLQRARLGTQWLLPARAYAQWLLNRKPLATMSESRLQRYLRRVPDLAAPVPYVFGTTVSIVEDVRGPKGSLDHPRGSVGQLVGIDGASYLVYRAQRGGVVRQRAVKPLNELALIRSSLPPSSAVTDDATQTASRGWREPIPPDAAGPVPQPRASSPPPPPPPTVDLPLNTRVEVLWPHPDGSSVWYAGEIVDSHTYGNGRRRHHVAYDGWPTEQWFWHDLASSDFEWRPLSAPLASDVAPRRSARRAGGSTEAPPPPPRYNMRHRPRADLAAVDAALEATQGPVADHYDAIIYQAFGDGAEPFSCHGDATRLDQQRAALAEALCTSAAAVYGARHHPAADAQCNKATQNVVDVVTPAGTQQITVPSTHRQLMASPQRDKWIAADNKALDAILAHPGNRLISKSVPESAGVPIAPCVTQRKVKVDQATGWLESRNAFKSRHCVDGNRLSSLLQRAAQATDNDTSSAVASDLLIKLLLADAALRDRDLVKADVPDAYPQGKRLDRPKTYMALPTAFAHWRADDGSELCLELTTPLWGEQSAGAEWQRELEATLMNLGWQPAENVPALWIYSGADGDAMLATIVDDLLFSESSRSGYSIAERTISKLTERYGDLRPEREPSSYAGLVLRRDRQARQMQLTMPQKAIEAAREHYPELLSSDASASPPPKGLALRRMADAMAMPTERPQRLDRKQVNTQRLIGSLKFMERLHPRLSLVLHRLSCVMSCPPSEAWDVARAALAAVYEERDVGLTFGGGGLSSTPLLEGSLKANIDLSEPAQADLAAHADATWGERNVYGLLLMYGGAAVVHQTKKIALVVDSSMESEAIASSRAGEVVTHAREILRAFGVAQPGPTLLTTDNLANQKVGSGLGCPTRSRHFLRRYHVLKQRIAWGDVTLRYVPDPQMPADFLTKWIPSAKLEASLRYATNSWARHS